MAIERFGTELLAFARDTGASFEKVLMIGRQNLNFRREEFDHLAQVLGFSVAEMVEQGRDASYAEPLFEKLGADVIDSIDCTSYEGAAIEHDMNLPLPGTLDAQYDIVFDGGSLEHIFNAPQAIANCMKLVKPGGLYMITTPSNGMAGHGFFQFSPEFFFRTLSEENGFEVVTLLICEVHGKRRMFKVTDPAKLEKRFEFRTEVPAYNAVIARKIAEKPTYASGWPQQADYSARWSGEQGGETRATGKSLKGKILSLLPAGVQQKVRSRLRQAKMESEIRAGMVEVDRVSAI